MTDFLDNLQGRFDPGSRQPTVTLTVHAKKVHPLTLIKSIDECVFQDDLEGLDLAVIPCKKSN